MSIAVMSSVWNSGKHANGALIVLLALGDWADDGGYCWPSVTRLAAKCRMSDRNVQIVLRQIEKDGGISRWENRGRGHSKALNC